MLAAAHGKVDRSLGVHDVDRAEGPAVDLKRFKMLFGRVAVALIERVGLDNRAVGNGCLKRFDEFAGQDVGTVLFTSMQLDGNVTVNALIDLVVKRKQFSYVG